MNDIVVTGPRLSKRHFINSLDDTETLCHAKRPRAGWVEVFDASGNAKPEYENPRHPEFRDLMYCERCVRQSFGRFN